MAYEDPEIAKRPMKRSVLASEHDEWLAAKAMAAHYVRDEDCTPARAIVRQAIEIERLVNVLKRLAEYPSTRSDEMSVEAMRGMARIALAPNALSTPSGVQHG